MVIVYVNQINQALEQGLYFPALALALALPDICAYAEYPDMEDKVGQRYISWYDKYIGHHFKEDDDYYVKERLIPYLGEPKQKDMNAAIVEENGMEDRVRVRELDDCIAVSFDAGDGKIVAIGSKMQEICESAYMNGYNWDAFINAYLEQNAPDIRDELDSDPEAEMYSVYINDTGDAGKAAAERLKKILEELFDNEDEIYSFLEEYADEIEWD